MGPGPANRIRVPWFKALSQWSRKPSTSRHAVTARRKGLDRRDVPMATRSESRRRSSLAGDRFCVIKGGTAIRGWYHIHSNLSGPHRLVRPRTSALQAENGGSNPPGDTPPCTTWKSEESYAWISRQSWSREARREGRGVRCLGLRLWGDDPMMPAGLLREPIGDPIPLTSKGRSVPAGFDGLWKVEIKGTVRGVYGTPRGDVFSDSHDTVPPLRRALWGLGPGSADAKCAVALLSSRAESSRTSPL